MLYLSGVHALNIDCKLNTAGDWHSSALRWDVINERLKDSDCSLFKDYGIEKDKQLSFLDGKPNYNVANHIRACLDLIAEGNFAQVQGMRGDFICTDEYDEEIFQKVLLLKESTFWNRIDDFMGREYSMKWLRFKKKEAFFEKIDHKNNTIHWENDKEKLEYFEIMCKFLKGLNSNSQDFVLKGGIALMVCYGLDRFSENIDLDSTNRSVDNYVKKFCETNNYVYKKTSDTDITKQFQIYYSKNKKPLKVEISYRQKQIDEKKTEIINGIKVYKINELFKTKMNAYNNRDKIRDLYDVVYIIKNFKEQLSSERLDMFKDILSYKGLEQFDYLIKTQKDELINNEKLANDFFDVFDKLDLSDDYHIQNKK